MAAAQAWSANLSGDGRTERVPGLQVTPGAVRPCSASQPALGRVLSGPDDGARRSRFVVIGHALWTRRFGADRAHHWETCSAERRWLQIVGVMPRRLPLRAVLADAGGAVGAARSPCATSRSRRRSLRLFAQAGQRCHPGCARAEIRVLNDRLVQAHPDTNRGLTTGVALLSEKADPPRAADDSCDVCHGRRGPADRLRQRHDADLVRSLGRTRELAVRSPLAPAADVWFGCCSPKACCSGSRVHWRPRHRDRRRSRRWLDSCRRMRCRRMRRLAWRLLWPHSRSLAALTCGIVATIVPAGRRGFSLLPRRFAARAAPRPGRARAGRCAGRWSASKSRWQ